jgi:hypothetical protein
LNLKRYYSYRDIDGKVFRKIIYSMKNEEKNAKFAILQYKEHAGLHLKPHGNTKTTKSIHSQTKNSIRDRAQRAAEKQETKQVTDIIEEEQSGPIAAKSTSDLVNNRMQEYRETPTCCYTLLLQLMMGTSSKM